ncbi:MAG: Na+-driven multidrug efflux pump [Myxococcota bacterium]
MPEVCSQIMQRQEPWRTRQPNTNRNRTIRGEVVTWAPILHAPTVKKSLLLPLALPLVISFWLRSAFAWVDTIFASLLHSDVDGTIGDASIAAIGLTLPLDFLLTAFWVGTSNGVTARLAAAMGANRSDEVAQIKATTHKIILCLCLFAIAAAVTVWMTAEHLGLDPTVAKQFKIYATVMMLGSAFTSFWSILPDSLVKAHHDTRSTMWAGLWSSVTNLSLNALFLFVFEWGIFGIAFSTVIGRIAGFVYATTRARYHEERRIKSLVAPILGVSPNPIRGILWLAIPSSITFVLMGFESFAINGILKDTTDSVSALASWSIFDRSVRFLTMPIIAASVAMLPLVARLQGENKGTDVRFELFAGMRAAMLYVIAFVTPIVYFVGPKIASALSDSATTQAATQEVIFMVPLAIFGMAPFLLSRATFDGLQQPRPGLIASAVRSFVFVIPLAMYGAHNHAEYGLSQIQAISLGYIAGLMLSSLGFWLWTRKNLIRLQSR